ncbi:hypothetical protein [Streptomyces massasporeus]|uniref:hypothetical protein n=1 Tax=Streptomyces massasporeus TaxID=67324 RepID=UPI00370062E8
MSYDLRAVIAHEEMLRVAARDMSAARLASIGQGLSLMPMTDALFETVAEGGDDGAWGFQRFPGGFEKGSPVSQALRRLGVVARAGEDEFTTVGLDRHRHSEAWVS